MCSSVKWASSRFYWEAKGNNAQTWFWTEQVLSKCLGKKSILLLGIRQVGKPAQHDAVVARDDPADPNHPKRTGSTHSLLVSTDPLQSKAPVTTSVPGTWWSQENRICLYMQTPNFRLLYVNQTHWSTLPCPFMLLRAPRTDQCGKRPRSLGITITRMSAWEESVGVCPQAQSHSQTSTSL